MLLSTDLWVSALLKRVEMAGSFATIARKGDARAGSVIVKVLNLRTRDAYVLREAQTGEDTLWMRPVETLNEPDIDAYIERQVKYDPDIWVVEIEDAEGRNYLTEKVERF
ncbi:MAG TPA: DUF1491 family protein [Asticcacaulis sp.]|nr:DUF1491 family protein [Asticcacaulis sp.]